MRRLPERDNGRDAKPAGTDQAGGHGNRVTELFVAHNQALMRFLTCRLKSTQEAKEVAQEAYVRMLQLDAPDGVSYLQAYLFKTASNLAADRLKSAARRGRIDQLDFFGEVDSAPSPEDGVAARQEIDRVLEIIEELPAKCRYAFVMHRFHQHSLPEIARMMSLSERMVRLYVERAVEYCRQRLNGQGARHE